ncbi:MAG: IclR family transcriptional regulator [Synergistales bacterium]|nr:IclR family transcriptional regulator [Synergistales bacterium]
MKKSAIEKALAVLESFSKDHREQSISEIAQRQGLPFSSTHRIASRLVDLGYLYRDPHTKQLSLGTRVYYLGKIAALSMNIINIALPFMEELRDTTGETVNLYFREGDSRICYEHAQSNQRLQFSVELGKRMPLWAGASGKCFLAYLPEEQFEEIVAQAQPLTKNTIAERDALARETALIRKRGYSMSHSEREEGVSSVAVPIFNREGAVVASLAVSGPSFRFDDARLDNIIAGAVGTARKISAALGYEPSRTSS